MTVVIAIDAGGTRTRAMCVDEDGEVLGFASSSSGNPIAVGEEQADAALVRAISSAIAEADVPPSSLSGMLCRAGDLPPVRAHRLASAVGLRNDALTLVGDSIAAYAAGTDAPSGLAAVVGTGAVVSVIHNSAVTASLDGLGWLLGDGGSGFALGREVARAVAADLDGRGPRTALTDVLVPDDGRAGRHRWGPHRKPQISRLLDLAYDGPPISLARLAPAAFAAEASDAVARKIVADGDRDAAALLRASFRHSEGPVVVAGSVILEGYLATRRPYSAVRDALNTRQVAHAHHPIVGAALLSLRAAGITLGPDIRQRCSRSLEQVMTAAPHLD